MPQRIGEILVERGKLDPANLERALKLQEGESREKIGVILLRLGMVSGRDLADALADQLDIPLAPGAPTIPELPLMEERLSRQVPARCAGGAAARGRRGAGPRHRGSHAIPT